MSVTVHFLNAQELAIQLPRIRDAFRASARSSRSLKGAFRQMGREIDAVIKDRFTGKQWAPLTPRTIDARFREIGYYGEVVPRQDKIGRWSDDMYQGLLGRGVLGEIVVEADEYFRNYVDNGPRANRVIWFHRGTRIQKPRPFWREYQRSEIANDTLREYFKTRVTSKFL